MTENYFFYKYNLVYFVHVGLICVILQMGRRYIRKKEGG